jgi:hypothetical protein
MQYIDRNYSDYELDELFQRLQAMNEFGSLSRGSSRSLSLEAIWERLDDIEFDPPMTDDDVRYLRVLFMGESDIRELEADNDRLADSLRQAIARQERENAEKAAEERVAQANAAMREIAARDRETARQAERAELRARFGKIAFVERLASEPDPHLALQDSWGRLSKSLGISEPSDSAPSELPPGVLKQLQDEGLELDERRWRKVVTLERSGEDAERLGRFYRGIAELTPAERTQVRAWIAWETHRRIFAMATELLDGRLTRYLREPPRTTQSGMRADPAAAALLDDLEWVLLKCSANNLLPSGGATKTVQPAGRSIFLSRRAKPSSIVQQRWADIGLPLGSGTLELRSTEPVQVCWTGERALPLLLPGEKLREWGLAPGVHRTGKVILIRPHEPREFGRSAAEWLLSHLAELGWNISEL